MFENSITKSVLILIKNAKIPETRAINIKIREIFIEHTCITKQSREISSITETTACVYQRAS